MRHVRIPGKVKFQFRMGENGWCQDVRRGEFPNLLGWKFTMSKNSGKMDLQICLWQMRHVRISKTLIFQVCLCGIDHVQMSGKVTLQIC